MNHDHMPFSRRTFAPPHGSCGSFRPILPARFGDTPLCHQLVEEEAGDGRPRLALLVHPDRGPLDESAVADAFLEAIASLGPMQRVMSRVWRDTGVLRVVRARPQSTPGGKVLHLHSRAAGGRST